MWVAQPLDERTPVNTEKQFLLCQKADGTIFLLIEKKRNIYIPYHHQSIVPMKQFPQIVTLSEMMVMKLIYKSMS